MFIQSCSRLIADYCGIPYTEKDTDKNNIVDLLRDVNVPEFVPSNKVCLYAYYYHVLFVYSFFVWYHNVNTKGLNVQFNQTHILKSYEKKVI